MMQHEQQNVEQQEDKNVCICVSMCFYRVQLFHLFPQHSWDHPDQTPLLQLPHLFIQISEQRANGGAFTMELSVPVHPSDREHTHTHTPVSLLCVFFGCGCVCLCSLSLVFEEDVENISLVLETLSFLQKLHQSHVIHGSTGICGNAAPSCPCHIRSLEDKPERLLLKKILPSASVFYCQNILWLVLEIL